MDDYLHTTLLPSGKIKCCIVTSDGTYTLSIELLAIIDRYIHDIIWKPGMTHRLMYTGKHVHLLNRHRYAYELRIGIVHYLP